VLQRPLDYVHSSIQLLFRDDQGRFDLDHVPPADGMPHLKRICDLRGVREYF
jgi:hypothetical protein